MKKLSATRRFGKLKRKDSMMLCNRCKDVLVEAFSDLIDDFFRVLTSQDPALPSEWLGFCTSLEVLAERFGIKEEVENRSKVLKLGLDLQKNIS